MNLVWSLPVLVAGIVVSGTDAVRAEGLGTEAWSADLDRFVAAIHEHHPDPFRDASEAEFTAAVAALRSDLAVLPDRQVVVRLAELAALLKDGHTRLSVPKYLEEVGLKPGHQPDFAVVPALRFAQLPIELDSFSDGVFIVRGAGEARALVGRRVVSYAGIEIGEAIARIGRTASAENDGMRRLIALDRLALPEVAMATGVGASADTVTLVLEDGAGKRTTVTLQAPGDDAEAVWREAIAVQPPRAGDRVAGGFARETVGDGNVVQLRIDEIPDARAPAFIGFIAAAAAEAEARDARLAIDVRWCFGGNGSINRGIVLAIAQSAELNQWGRTFVLTGPRTFSACQQLTDALQQYARAIVVGDPTGSRPDHFGDSRRVKLDRSGLTLRVSTIHWNSWIGGDTRLAQGADAVFGGLHRA